VARFARGAEWQNGKRMPLLGDQWEVVGGIARL